VSAYYGDLRELPRPASRYIAFGLAILIGVGALGTRLFYLEIANATRPSTPASALSAAAQPLRASRGLIYDRVGRPLVANVPVYTVWIRPADLPLPRRDEVVARLASLIGIAAADLNAAIDAKTGSTFELIRVGGPIARDSADLIIESGAELPGVQVVIETRRQYPQGRLLSQIVGYTARINAQQLARDTGGSYLAADTIGVAGVEATYETQLRGQYGAELVERDRAGRNVQVVQTTAQPRPGASLRLTIDSHEQSIAQQALQWGMKAAGLERGVVIVMNPQTGEILALVTLPTYDDNAFAGGISTADFERLAKDPNKPLTNHAIQAQYAPGSTYKLVAGTGGLADGKISARTRLVTRPYLTLGNSRFYDWNRRGFGACDIRCGFGHSSDTFFFQVAGMLGIDRLGYWAHEFGFGARTGIDLPGEVPGIVPTSDWKTRTTGLPIYPGEVYQAGIGQGYDAVTPIQLITAYGALANGGKVMQPQVVREITAADGTVLRPFEPRVAGEVAAPPSVLREMRQAARHVVLVRHTYNLVDLPVIVAGKSGTAEFGLRDRKGRLPFHSWFVGFVPANPRIQPGDPRGLKAVARTDSNLIVLAFAYDSRTKGNAATEIAKYFLQLHFGIRKDYRIPNLLLRDNFYEGN
jgi:penicillin-binding protein 2